MPKLMAQDGLQVIITIIGIPILAPTIMDGIETISFGLQMVVSTINSDLDVVATLVHHGMAMECMEIQGSTAIPHGMVVLTTTIQHGLHIVVLINIPALAVV